MNRSVIFIAFFFVFNCGLSRAAVIVNSVSALRDAINQTALGGEKTILVANGTYLLGGTYFRITSPGVIVRSASGNRDMVILDGEYLTTEIFQIVANNVTIRDLSLKRAQDHPIHIMGSESNNTIGTVIHNVRIIDPGQQAIKVNSNFGHTVDQGIISNSLLELTDTGRSYVWTRNGSCYTGGIDAHQATGWIVRDNTIKGFWCAEGLSEHGIHFWSGSTNTLVERNLIVDCDRGIGFGLGASPHYNGIIRNNMIYHPLNHGYSDVGISLESASNAKVFNNTIYLNHNYPNAIEYRFSASRGISIINNLTNRQISMRDGGTASLISNKTNVLASSFVNPGIGDLHLTGNISGIVDAGIAIPGLDNDIDLGVRPYGGGFDIGADEYGANGPDNTGNINNSQWLLLLQDE